MTAPRTASTLRAAIGPGLLMAGAAVGVSHLVQSTRAGAEYGLALAVLVVIGCVLKFPFLEFGPRYAAATGESLVAGYRRMGRWALGLFALITVSTMFIVSAAVTLVTAGLAGLLFGLDLSATALSLLVLTACTALLVFGHYRALDRIMKIIMAGLALVTLIAVVLALGAAADGAGFERLAASLSDDRLRTGATLGFVLALLGWMPIPLDAAAWHSLWTVERARQTGHRPSLREAAVDFHIGYAGATLLALAFLLLGALTMYGTGSEFAGGAVAFAGQFVDLYARSLGDWSRPLIATAALATMLSTTLTVIDAFPRVLRALVEQAAATDEDRDRPDPARHRALYLSGLALIVVGALGVIAVFGAQFTALIDFITTVSFLAAPVVAWLNLRLLTGRWTPEHARPGPALRGLSWAGLVFLVAFSLIWAGWRLTG